MSDTEIPPALGDAIRSAIADLDSIRTSKNRDKIVWAQYVLTACADLIGEPAFKVKRRARNEVA